MNIFIDNYKKNELLNKLMVIIIKINLIINVIIRP